MARLTIERVRQAVAELKEQSLKPTNKNIITNIGYGSYSTLTKLRKEYPQDFDVTVTSKNLEQRVAYLEKKLQQSEVNDVVVKRFGTFDMKKLIEDYNVLLEQKMQLEESNIELTKKLQLLMDNYEAFKESVDKQKNIVSVERDNLLKR